MPFAVSRHLALLAALGLAASPLAAQEKSLPQRIADVIVQLNGGIHTGFRFMHAKGLVVTGTFTPAPSARGISSAAHFIGGEVPVTVRFSDGTGNPTIPDTDTRGSPRGMAIRFTLPHGAFTDIVAISHNGFVVGTGEDFLAFLTAVAHTTPQSPHPNPVEQFLQAHPRALKFIQDAQPLPVSFATLAYFGNNAFVFVDSAGVKRAGRYRILPAAGVATLDSARAAKAGPEYLFQDLKRRLARGPVRFRLVAQMAAPATTPRTARSSGPTIGRSSSWLARLERGGTEQRGAAAHVDVQSDLLSRKAFSCPTIRWCRCVRPSMHCRVSHRR